MSGISYLTDWKTFSVPITMTKLSADVGGTTNLPTTMNAFIVPVFQSNGTWTRSVYVPKYIPPTGSGLGVGTAIYSITTPLSGSSILPFPAWPVPTASLVDGPSQPIFSTVGSPAVFGVVGKIYISGSGTTAAQVGQPISTTGNFNPPVPTGALCIYIAVGTTNGAIVDFGMPMQEYTQ